jgi:hypothetical protein
MPKTIFQYVRSFLRLERTAKFAMANATCIRDLIIGSEHPDVVPE